MSKALAYKLDTLKQLWEIHDYIVNSSSLLPEEEKIRMKRISAEDTKRFHYYSSELPEMRTALAVNGSIEIFLCSWNDWFSLDTERFWEEVNIRKLPVKRKKDLRSILKRGRIYDVHEAMSLRTQWEALINSKYVKEQFSREEQVQLQEIMDKDENLRVELLRKILRTNNVPLSSALKFWDTMAYFSRFNLYEKHFSPQEKFNIFRIRHESDEKFSASHG